MPTTTVSELRGGWKLMGTFGFAASKPLHGIFIIMVTRTYVSMRRYK
jgi:hypothetical protein